MSGQNYFDGANLSTNTPIMRPLHLSLEFNDRNAIQFQPYLICRSKLIIEPL